MLSTKNRNILLVVTLFFILLLFVVATVWTQRDGKINIILDNHSKTLQTNYEILQYNQQITADITYEETMNLKEFIDIYSQAYLAKQQGDEKSVTRLRDQAKQLLDKKYQIIRKKGILQYHFIFPDNKVFLRMHKPNKFGDDLSEVRTDFNYTNSTKKIIRGFAQGRTAHAFRNVYPVFNENKQHIGAMEVSFSSEVLQDYFTKVNKLHTHFLVNKDIFKSNAWKRDDLILKYIPSSENEDFMMTMTDNHSKQTCIITNSKRIAPISSEIIKNMANNKMFSLYTIFEDRSAVASFFPIKHNITKEPVAWIVSYQNDALIDKTIKEFNLLLVFVTVILLFICWFIYYILNQRNILDQKVTEKTKDLQETNKTLQLREEELQHLNDTLATKIEKEVERNRKKDHLIAEQSKMAALGEMIGNIAHQWRQPLSVISTGATGVQLQQEMGILEKDHLLKTCKTINENAQYLSRTIDDFSTFIKGQSKKELFYLHDSINSFLSLMDSSIKKYQIKVIVNIADDIKIDGYQNELDQCLINLFNNSKDALLFVEPLKLVSISAYREDDHIAIIFKDNGGGIDDTIISKVFEPYFTTKHKSQGTGLGLNMTYRLITDGMNGHISVENELFEYESKTYTGAKFKLTLPIK